MKIISVKTNSGLVLIEGDQIKTKHFPVVDDEEDKEHPIEQQATIVSFHPTDDGSEIVVVCRTESGNRENFFDDNIISKVEFKKPLARQLYNTQEDKEYLNGLLNKDFPLPVKVYVVMGVFESPLASSLKETPPCVGYVTYLDMESGYCDWFMDDKKMPSVNINCISLL